MQTLKNKSGKEQVWKFTDECGSFKWEDPGPLNRLYFPLCNEKGMMSSISPILHGDIKTGQESFLTPPATVEDLHNTRSARNFWLYITGYGPWSVSGISARQRASRFAAHEKEGVVRSVEAGFLWHKLVYRDMGCGIEAETLNFVPLEDNVEIMRITVKNISSEPVTFTPTSAVPLFCRSAENIRDHRHVTGLVNRYMAVDAGFAVQPLIKFDERGHKFSETMFSVTGSEEDGTLPTGVFPSAEEFIGAEGDYEWPEVVVKNFKPDADNGKNYDGKEYVGALRFRDCTLAPGATRTYLVHLGIHGAQDGELSGPLKYNTFEKTEEALNRVKKYWKEKVSNPDFSFADNKLQHWMNWVELQPVLRTLFGNSFLPYHDYGKGGRGWRDLWQDLLALLLFKPEHARQRLLENFAGIRIDGTNATIIGHASGEFFADRNNITRVWMDHGSWPWITVKLYLDQTGDYPFLLEEQKYFQDALRERAGQVDNSWNPDMGTTLKTRDGREYSGSILEHLLVQHLVSIHNTGANNLLKLEDADWNDAIDMASDKGESVPFSALYAANLLEIASVLRKMQGSGLNKALLFEELLTLVNSESQTTSTEKQQDLARYFSLLRNGISGKRIDVPLEKLAAGLEEKGKAILDLIRKQEWIAIDGETGFFNSYYNNDGESVGGDFDGEVVMDLIGQAFCLMTGAADDSQIPMIYNACRKYLKDPEHGGYRLNTPYKNCALNFGRVFAFNYGEKENGATFSHMVIMFVNALLKRGLAVEGAEVFRSLYELSNNALISGIYPGVPEYFTADGRGMYPYLTGTASWLILTMLQWFFGIRGDGGDMLIEPLLTEDFFNGNQTASVETEFAGYRIRFLFNNPEALPFGKYHIRTLTVNGNDYFSGNDTRVSIPVGEFETLFRENEVNRIDITLA